MPKRVDINQAEIVKMLRAFGASVIDLHEVGHGCPDILVGYKWHSFPMEIKSAEGKLTPDEVKFNEEWRGNYYIVHSFEEAVQILIDSGEAEE
jgi:hypothetical protein